MLLPLIIPYIWNKLLWHILPGMFFVVEHRQFFTLQLNSWKLLRSTTFLLGRGRCICLPSPTASDIRLYFCVQVLENVRTCNDQPHMYDQKIPTDGMINPEIFRSPQHIRCITKPMYRCQRSPCALMALSISSFAHTVEEDSLLPLRRAYDPSST